MADDVVIVDANGNEHHFPSGFDPKRAASIVSTQIAADVRSRPLLTGRSDAGVAQQLPNDPNALAEVRGKQATGEDAGIMAGVAGLGGAAMGIPGVARETGRALLYGGAYQAAKKLGVPPSLLDAVMVFEGARGIPGAITRIKAANAPPPESPNAGGRLVTTKAPGFEQQMTDALGQLRGGAPPESITTSPQPRLPAGYTPRTEAPPLAGPTPPNPNSGGILRRAPAPRFSQDISDALSELQQQPRGGSGTLPPQPTLPPGYAVRMVGAKMANPNIASVEAAAPAAQAQSGINPADMPRSWHAYEDATSRTAADPVERAQAAALHEEIAQTDQAYRARALDQPEFLVTNHPLSFRDALVALLKGPK